MRLPRRLGWLFWEMDSAQVDLARDADYVIARIVEHGTLAEVKWAVRHYGIERIHHFFRSAGHPELSARTRGFWRAFFHAGDEPWPERPSWRQRSAVHWPG
ncbi:MAG: hypothetical protein HY744_00800 [Deltaproteobacteria bacterium]|nr:hypothetical protein [Deltaproteobacteria bacterium]